MRQIFPNLTLPGAAGALALLFAVAAPVSAQEDRRPSRPGSLEIISATDDGGGKVRVEWKMVWGNYQTTGPLGSATPERLCAYWGRDGAWDSRCWSGLNNNNDLVFDTGIGSDRSVGSAVFSVLLQLYFRRNVYPPLWSTSIVSVEVRGGGAS